MISVSQHMTTTSDSSARLSMQITSLVDSYMIWVGSADATTEDSNPEENGKLCRDWAYAMPQPNKQPIGTTLFRTSASDAALSMAQRIARKTNKAIFLSADVSPQHTLVAEKWVVDTLRAL
ncbi:hypothetical protein CYLTODRAFT_489807 [Cylindrobasidium torrendii FP15055 ss-10]|uniref:Uncharacterized protein n=1 Tax=Cylindrobasidium torrendii FP15055 ss-10 TaxID=1314674 RepID=A0A0D7BE28_9AGAR|nr:hypothetical protein CYLTODRAFT_489807 [Cylindrobasidium torrendii FP15055 ss-10]